MKNPTTPSLYRYPRRGGGTSDIKWQGWPKDFFWVGKFWKYCFGLAWFNGGNFFFGGGGWGWYSTATFYFSLEIFMAQKFGMGFVWCEILVQGFFWVLLEALAIFLGLIFASIRSSLSLEIRSTPAPCLGQSTTLTQDFRSHAKHKYGMIKKQIQTCYSRINGIGWKNCW